MSVLPRVELPFSGLPMELQYIITEYMDPCNLESWREIGEGYCKNKQEKHPIYLSFHKFMDAALPFGGPRGFEEALRRTLEYPIKYGYKDSEEVLQYLAQLDHYWTKKAQASPNNEVCCTDLDGSIQYTDWNPRRSS